MNIDSLIETHQKALDIVKERRDGWDNHWKEITDRMVEHNKKGLFAQMFTGSSVSMADMWDTKWKVRDLDMDIADREMEIDRLKAIKSYMSNAA